MTVTPKDKALLIHWLIRSAEMLKISLSTSVVDEELRTYYLEYLDNHIKDLQETKEITLKN